MYCITFLQGMVFYAPISTVFRQARGINIEQIFLLQSILSIVIIMAEIPLGYISDKIGYKKALIFSNITLFVSKIVFYKANSFLLFFCESILMGISIAAASGCDIALIYESSDKKNGEVIFGKYLSIGSISFLLASLMSTYFIKISFDIAALATIFPHAICAILTFFLKDIKCEYVSKKNMIEDFHEIKEFFSNKHIKSIFRLVIFTSLISSSIMATTVFLNQIKYTSVGINFTMFGILNAILQIMAVLSCKTYKLTEIFGRFKAFLFLLFLTNTGIFILIFTKSISITIISMMIISGSHSMLAPIIIDIQNEQITKNRATTLSIYSMIENIICAIVNILIGITAKISLTCSLTICFIISIISTIGICMIITKKSCINENIDELEV